MLLGLVILAVVSAPLWQERWVTPPQANVRIEPKLAIINESELSPDTAFGLFRQAEKLINPVWKAHDDRKSVFSPESDWSQERQRIRKECWSNEGFPIFAEALEQNQAALDLVRKAARAPAPLVPTMFSLAESTPDYLNSVFAMCTLLNASANKHAAHGQYAAMETDIYDSLGLAFMVSRGGAAVHHLVTVTQVIVICDLVGMLAKQNSLPREVADNLILALAECETRLPDPAESLRYEALAMLNLIDSIYERRKGVSAGGQNIHLPGWMLPLAALAGSTPNATKQNIRWCFEHLIALVEQGDAGTKMGEFVVKIQSRVKGEHSLLLMRDPLGFMFSRFLAMLPAPVRMAREAECSLRGTQLILALEAYRQETGKLPADLSTLVPKFIRRIPDDPFLPGSPLRILVHPEDDSYSIYSVGPNRTDDGGKSRIVGKRKVRPGDKAGDYVIGDY